MKQQKNQSNRRRYDPFKGAQSFNLCGRCLDDYRSTGSYLIRRNYEVEYMCVAVLNTLSSPVMLNRNRGIPMNKEEKRTIVPVWERRLLTLEEAAAYSGIGTRTLKTISDDPSCEFVLWIGRKRMFKRTKLDRFIDEAYSI